jgi:hypothetical protein
MRQRLSKQGADTSLRLGDDTLRKIHYQTTLARRQPLVASCLSRPLTAIPPPGHKERIIKISKPCAHGWSILQVPAGS